MDSIEESSVESNSASVCRSESPSVRAREKLAIIPGFSLRR